MVTVKSHCFFIDTVLPALSGRRTVRKYSRENPLIESDKHDIIVSLAESKSTVEGMGKASSKALRLHITI
ncbi:hypothetical protein CCE28_00860 [Anaeromicrobium sediminis]|uniref:Uncharacterized protein n=1 Tax=Anaeromicrobium sediminis TaxID=1478221 RepID=A0A267MNN3_9FIRM|nr:hypothetical protein CCE28_00860 [Anaeromicrobium sediminis]